MLDLHKIWQNSAEHSSLIDQTRIPFVSSLSDQARNIVRNIHIKIKVKILSISGVIQNLRFGHVT